jgi:hypothetical protein
LLPLVLPVRHGPGSTSAIAGSPPDLDSFSEPAIAAAVLKRSAQGLNEACAEDLSALSAAKTGALQARTAEWISRYETELNRQKEILTDGDLEHGLLILYKTCGRREDFVDGYLRLLGISPDQPVVWRWAGYALTYAQSCARSEEVLDALQHIARFGRDRQVADQVKAALQKWSAVSQPKSSDKTR